MIMATATFVCLGLLIASRLRAEATLGLANLIYLILLAGGALVVPLERYPAAVQPVLQALPTAALGEGLRAAADRLCSGLAGDRADHLARSGSRRVARKGIPVDGLKADQGRSRSAGAAALGGRDPGGEHRHRDHRRTGAVDRLRIGLSHLAEMH